MSNTPFRPADIETAGEGGGAQYLGFQACAITEFEDQTEKFDWADLFLRVQLQIEGSQYPVDMKILGSYDREPNGNIKTCSLLKKWYRFADTVGFTGGPDVTGKMVDEAGNALNLQKALDDHCQPHPIDPKLEYYCYVYKEPSKKDPSTSYTTVYPRITTNTEKGRAELESFIQFLKSKSLIKEAGDTPVVTQPNGQVTATTGQTTF